MGITSFYVSAPTADEEGVAAIEALVKAVEPAVVMIDTALIYVASRPGGKHNEEVVGEAVRKVGREKVFLATKGSMNADFSPDSSDAGLRAQLASSLKRLGLDSVDLYYEHRRDVKTAIEDVMRTMKALKEEGKIRFAGLSECTPAELRRAHAVFPVTAIQVEYSLQARVAVESELLAVARELGVAVVAYSPLGRGMLSGTFASRAEVPDGDWRKSSQPRWSEALAARNFEQAAKLKDIAARKACTPAQLALAWLLAKSDIVFPIPGTKSAVRAIENARAADVALTAADVAELEALVPEGEGDRYEGKWGQFEARL
jgi:aryl-alcohol dehydrogenase-like predicted oxidoreductase